MKILVLLTHLVQITLTQRISNIRCFYQGIKQFKFEIFSRNTPTCKSCSFKYVDKGYDKSAAHIRGSNQNIRGYEIRAVKQ
jgi:hypothetical protein